MTADEERAERLRILLRGSLGDEILAMLDDEDVTDIHVNPDGRLWCVSHTNGRQPTAIVFLPQKVELALSAIAGNLGLEINAQNPRLQGELPLNGSRVQGWFPPITAAPQFSIRKKSNKVYTLANYVTSGICSEEQANAVRGAIRAGWRFLVAGGTGSGKTTLANAILEEIVKIGVNGPHGRFAILEDTRELQCTALNKIEARSGDGVSMRDLLSDTLRNDPDVIVIGELRNEVAYDLLQAWNTGHGGGMTTIHANSAERSLLRLDQLAQQAKVPPQAFSIAYADLVVLFIAGKGVERRIREVVHVRGLDPQAHYQLDSLA